MNTKWYCLSAIMAMLVACKPQTPSQYIQPDDMEDLLVDYHIARALATESKDRYYDQALYEEAVFKKYGVTKAEFDSSLVYYYTRADRFQPICQRVADRLEERALILGATEGDIGKYAQLNATGDTANIWAERSAICMMPQPPYHRWEFTIEGDSTLRPGDTFLLQFMSNFVFQSGSRNGVLYMAVEYEDTTIVRHLNFTNTGLTQLHYDERHNKDIHRLYGFFYLDGARDESTTVRLLFLNNIQLIRFHNQVDEEEPEKDSLPLDNIARPVEIDTVSDRDTVGHRDALLPTKRRIGPDRVEARELEPPVR